jgi:hypothetical protein
MTPQIYLNALAELLRGAAGLDWSDEAIAAERAAYLEHELEQAIKFLEDGKWLRPSPAAA